MMMEGALPRAGGCPWWHPLSAPSAWHTPATRDRDAVSQPDRRGPSLCAASPAPGRPLRQQARESIVGAKTSLASSPVADRLDPQTERGFSDDSAPFFRTASKRLRLAADSGKALTPRLLRAAGRADLRRQQSPPVHHCLWHRSCSPFHHRADALCSIARNAPVHLSWASRRGQCGGLVPRWAAPRLGKLGSNRSSVASPVTGCWATETLRI